MKDEYDLSKMKQRKNPYVSQSQNPNERLGAIAGAYLTDPAFAQCREDEQAWDTTSGDGLENE